MITQTKQPDNTRAKLRIAVDHKQNQAKFPQPTEDRLNSLSLSCGCCCCWTAWAKSVSSGICTGTRVTGTQTSPCRTLL